MTFDLYLTGPVQEGSCTLSLRLHIATELCIRPVHHSALEYSYRSSARVSIAQSPVLRIRAVHPSGSLGLATTLHTDIRLFLHIASHRGRGIYGSIVPRLPTSAVAHRRTHQSACTRQALTTAHYYRPPRPSSYPALHPPLSRCTQHALTSRCLSSSLSLQLPRATRTLHSVPAPLHPSRHPRPRGRIRPPTLALSRTISACRDHALHRRTPVFSALPSGRKWRRAWRRGQG